MEQKSQSVRDFFVALRVLAGACLELRGRERFLAELCLEYLINESEKGGRAKNPRVAAFAWRFLHPILKRHNLLERAKGRAGVRFGLELWLGVWNSDKPRTSRNEGYR